MRAEHLEKLCRMGGAAGEIGFEVGQRVDGVEVRFLQLCGVEVALADDGDDGHPLRAGQVCHSHRAFACEALTI